MSAAKEAQLISQTPATKQLTTKLSSFNSWQPGHSKPSTSLIFQPKNLTFHPCGIAAKPSCCKQLLLLTGGPEALGAPAVANQSPTPSTPAVPAVPAADLVGKWGATGRGNAKFAMELTKEGTFTWTFTQAANGQRCLCSRWQHPGDGTGERRRDGRGSDAATGRIVWLSTPWRTARRSGTEVCKGSLMLLTA